MPDIYLEVLEPALREVGHRWAMGALNVAEEHYATAVAQSILDGLGPAAAARARRTGGWRSSPARPRSCTRSARAWSPTSSRPTAGRCCCSARARPRSDLRGAGRVRAARPRRALDRDRRRARRRRRGARRAGRARARARASSPAASSGRPRRARAALEFGADLVIQDPRELVATLHAADPAARRGRARPRRSRRNDHCVPSGRPVASRRGRDDHVPALRVDASCSRCAARPRAPTSCVVELRCSDCMTG